MLLEKPASGQTSGPTRWGLLVGSLIAVCAGATACGHSAGAAPDPGDAGCFVADGAISDPPRDDCPNDFSDGGDCPAASPSYQTDVAPIVEQKCTVCHAHGGIEPSPLFGSYAEIHATRLSPSTMEAFIYSCRMPPTCAPQLSDAERKTMLKWFACGALNN